ncbi:MAG: pantetheine-phosphate adenylyltransferase [Endomicrobiia bacterium]
MNKKTVAVYPGSFDPPTNGHIDLIIRSSKIFDKVIVSIITNPIKQPLFSVEERYKMLKTVTKKIKNVEIDTFNGLLVDYLRNKKIRIVIRGLRVISDFEYEFQMALTNRKLYPEIEIIYLMPSEKWTYISSSLVKEILRFGGDIKDFVPREIMEIIKEKF